MWRLKIAEGGSPWLRTLNDHVGRQVWEFDPKLGSADELAEIEKVREGFRTNRFQKKHSADLLMRYQFARDSANNVILEQVKVQDTEDVTEDHVTTTLRRAISFHSTIQAHDGHWPGDYGGPLFLLPGLVIALSIVGAMNTVLSKEHKREICRYIYNHQNRDGGWGLHIEGHSTMFGTTLNYVTLRLLGEEANDGEGAVEKGRKWILDHGGATAITSWGKMWLALLGVFEWSGNNPLPPELWLLPYILPFHPGDDKELILDTKKIMAGHFMTKDLGGLHYFLGMEFAKSTAGFHVCQRKFVLSLLAETGLGGSKASCTPMDPN